MTDPVSIPPPRRSAADRVAVVVNGNAKQVTNELVEVLDQLVQSGDLYVSRSLEEGREIASTLVERGYPTVLTGGGDGTFVQVVTWVNEAAKARGLPLPRFGFLRLGTGNALAWVVGAQNLPRRGVFADLARLRREGGSRQLRLLEVAGQLTPFAGTGTDAIVLSHFEGVKAKFAKVPLLRRFATGGPAYATAIITRSIPDQIVRPRRRVRVVNQGAETFRLGADGQRIGPPVAKGEVIYEGWSRMVIFSTIPYWGFGARVFPFAVDRDDRFQLRVVDVGPLTLASHVRGIWRGTFQHDGVHDFLVDRISVHYDEPIPLQVGGDLAGDRTDYEVRLYPEPIRVVDYYGPPPVD